MSSDTSATSELPTEFDLGAIDEYLRSLDLSASNRANCMRVIRHLVTGRGAPEEHAQEEHAPE